MSRYVRWGKINLKLEGGGGIEMHNMYPLSYP